MKTKILFVIATLGRGGAERSLLNLLEVLSPDQYEMSLLTFLPEGELADQIPEYVRWIKPHKTLEFLTCTSWKQKLRAFSVKAAIGQIKFTCVKRKSQHMNGYQLNQRKWEIAYNPSVPKLDESFDVAVAFMHSLPTYYVMEKVHSKRKIAWVHHDYTDYVTGKEFDRPYFEKADGIITVSEACKQVLQREFPEQADRFQSILNINSAQIIRRKADEFFPSEYERMNEARILSIGRLMKAKRFDRAIEAARLLKESGRRFTWYIIGVGEQRDDLLRQIQQQGLTNQVILLGARDNPYPYLKYADVVVQTSDTEGKSMVLDEAKILCKPIITTDYPTAHDQIEHRVNGLIVEKNSQSIADAINEVLDIPQIREQFINNLKNLPDTTQQELLQYHRVFGK